MTSLPGWRRARRAPGVPAGGFREAVVFSGGGSLGAAQVGALRAVIDAGVRPDLLVGCSVGALNAAFFAVDPTPTRLADLEGVWLGLGRRGVFPDGRFTVARRLLRRESFLHSPRALLALIDEWMPFEDLAQLPVPCHVVTTDLLAGQATWWVQGPAREVLSASACLPAVFPPVRLGGSLHVDGGVTCPVPVQRALDLSARRVWVLDVASEFHGWDGRPMGAMDVLLEAFAVCRSRLGRAAGEPGLGQRIVRLPALGVGRHDLRDFSRTPALIAAGLFAGRRMVRSELAAAPLPAAAASS
jgi:NTE family protein